MMDGFVTIRAIDRMNALAESGGTQPALVKARQKLRNRGVHPSKRVGALSNTDYQRLIDGVHQVTALMYHIVFALIGYKGPYTDYAEHGFPDRIYPPAAETTPSGMSTTPPVLEIQGSPPKAATKPVAADPDVKARKSKPSASKATHGKKKKRASPSVKPSKGESAMLRKRKRTK